MENKPLVILGSARKHSATQNFIKTALNGLDYTVIDLLDFEISHYNYSGEYPGSDGFFTITDEILKHNAIIFATPIYWYAMSGPMKIFFDRLTDLVTIKKETGRKLKGKSTFLLAVGADKELPEGFETPFRLTSAYLDMAYQSCVYQSIKSPVNESSFSGFREKVKQHI